MKEAFVRIVQDSPSSDAPTLTQGTQVMVGDVKMSGVTRIELIAEVNDIWRARIDCYVHGMDLCALATIHEPTLWQRFKRWMERNW